MLACKVTVYMHKSSCKVQTKTAMLRNDLGSKVTVPAVANFNTTSCAHTTSGCMCEYS